MEASNTSIQELVCPRNRDQLISLFGIFLYYLIGEAGCVWEFIIILGGDDSFLKIVSLGILLLFSSGLFFAPVYYRVLRLMLSNIPVLQINQQGITLIDPYRFSFKSALIPWSEIAKLSCFHSRNLLFTITLKDPQHWWSLSANRHRRKMIPHRVTGAHFHIVQSATTISFPELLQQIHENFAREIQANEVEMVPFASKFTHRSRHLEGD